MTLNSSAKADEEVAEFKKAMNENRAAVKRVISEAGGPYKSAAHHAFETCRFASARAALPD